MSLTNNVTAADMIRIFIPEGECNGQGSRHVQDGALTRIHPCNCVTCESGKAERKQAKERAYQEGIAKARRILNEHKRRNQPSAG